MSNPQSESGRKQLAEKAKRIVGLQAEVADLKAQAKEIEAQISDEYKEAKADGWNAKALKNAIKTLAMDADERQQQFEFEDDVDLYRLALGCAPAADQIVHEMTDNERDEVHARIIAGQDATTGVIQVTKGRVLRPSEAAADASTA